MMRSNRFLFILFILVWTTAVNSQTIGLPGVSPMTSGTPKVYTIGSTSSCTNGTVAASATFTTTGTFTAGNIWTLQMSSTTGTWGSPTALATISGTAAGTYTFNWNIAQSVAYGTGYRFRVVSSAPVVTSADNGYNITICPITFNNGATLTNQTGYEGQPIAFSLTATDPSGTATFNYKWKESVDGGTTWGGGSGTSCYYKSGGMGTSYYIGYTGTGNAPNGMGGTSYYTTSNVSNVASGTASTLTITPPLASNYYVCSNTGFTGYQYYCAISMNSIAGATYYPYDFGPCAGTLTVNASGVTVGTISGNNNICNGQSTTLTCTNPGGCTLQWQQDDSYPGGCNDRANYIDIAGATGTSITVSPVTSKSYRVFYKKAGGCGGFQCGKILEYGVSVNQIPNNPTAAYATDAGATSGSGTNAMTVPCGDANPIALNLTYSNHSCALAGDVVKWYTGSCGGTLVGTGNPLTLGSTPTATTTYYGRVETGSACNAITTCQSITITITGTPSAPTSVSAWCNGSGTTPTFCSGTSPCLQASGGSYTSLNWYTGSCGGTFVGSGSNPFGLPSISSNTTYYLCASNACGSASTTVSVTVDATMSAPTGASTTAACVGAGGNITLTSSGGSAGSTGTLYWSTGFCQNTSIGTGNNLSVSAPASSTTYYAWYGNSGCNTNCSSVTFTPTQPSTSSPSTLSSGSKVWAGYSSGNYATPGNWLDYNGSSFAVATVKPSSSTDVYVRLFSSCVANAPVVTSGTTETGQNIEIASGATLTTAGTGILQANGSFTNYGTFTANSGTLSMVGTSLTNVNLKTNGSTLYNLLINKNSSSTVNLLTDDASVSNQLTLTNNAGNISTGTAGVSPMLVFTAAYPVGNNPAEASNSRIKGTALMLAKTAGTAAFGPFLGVTMGASAADIGNLTITRVTDIAGSIITVSGGNHSIACYWDLSITGTQPAAGKSLTLSWLSDLDNGLTWSSANNNLAVTWKNTSPGVNPWTGFSPATDVSCCNPRNAVATATSFSRWTISQKSLPLPVELLYFNGKNLGDKTQLSWSTATETNNDFFTLDKSPDAQNYQSFARIDGAGTSSSEHVYEAYDYVPFKGASYYRLKQTDFDGKTTTFTPISVFTSSPGILIISRNSNSGDYLIDFHPAEELHGNYTMEITTAMGQSVFKETLNNLQGSYQREFDLLSSGSGVYLVSIISATDKIVKRIVVY